MAQAVRREVWWAFGQLPKLSSAEVVRRGARPQIGAAVQVTGGTSNFHPVKILFSEPHLTHSLDPSQRSLIFCRVKT
jgi:hypothetical protein